jgi:transposase
MESTGVLWKPVYNLLEGLGLTLPVVNAHHIKSVPGRKTDIKDAEWIAKLLQHGLLRCSYIPDRPNRELCELVRYRRSLIQQRAQAVNRIQKVLEGANIKLSSVASDITGVSGRAMLEAISSGQDDPDRLVLLAKGRLQSKRVELKQALRGLTGPPQRLLIQSLLRQLDFLANEVTSFALAHTILVMIYYMLVRGTSYQELGGNYFDERNEQAAIKRAVNRIEQLGYKVTLELAAS